MRASSSALLVTAAALALTACQKKTEAPAAPEAQPAPAAAAPAEAPNTLPARKPGLWEVRTSGVDTTGTPSVMRMCLDAAVEKQMSIWGESLAGECHGSRPTRQADGSWTFDSTCDRGTGGVSTLKGVATGDMQSHYQIRMDISTTGASVPQMNRSLTQTQDASYMGACPADMQPGDAEMMTAHGRMRVNLLKLKPPVR